MALAEPPVPLLGEHAAGIPAAAPPKAPAVPSIRPALGALLTEPLALPHDTVARLVRHIAAGQDPAEFVAAYGRLDLNAIADQRGPVAVIPIAGFISEKRSPWDEYYGGTSLEAVRLALRAALGNPAVRAIVFDVSSPGGTVSGCTELAREIREAKGQGKRLVAVSNSLMCSAAYWIVAGCDEIVATPSSTTGSIGIYAVHQEYSRMLDAAGIGTTVISAGEHKTEGNEWEPLTDEALAYLQSRADTMNGWFVGDVAKGRGITAAKVDADFGQGRGLFATEALAAGMVDSIDTFDRVLVRAERQAVRAARGLSAEDPTPEELAAEDAPAEEAEGTARPEPFLARLGWAVEEAASLLEHGTKRAELRAKEERPALSDDHITAARSIRAAMDGLLALVDPAPEPDPVAADPPEPPAVHPPREPSAQPAAASAPRFRTDADWKAYLERGNR